MKIRILAWLCLLLCLPLAAFGEDYLVTDQANAAGAAATTASDGAAQPATAAAPVSDAALAAAIAQLEAGSYLNALNDFAKLGGNDAPHYEKYAQARLLMLRDDPAAAIPLLEGISGFIDSDYQLALCKALRLHRYQDNGKFGYVDETGAWRIAPQFDWAERVFRAQSAAEHPLYDAAFDTADTYTVAAVFVGETVGGQSDLEPVTGKYGLLRCDGTLIADTRFDSVLWAKGGYAAMADAAGCTLYRIADGAQVGGTFEALEPYTQGYIAAKQGGLWGYLDAATGQPIGDGYVWSTALPFSEGKAAVSQGKNYGYIDTAGQVVIPLTYTGAASFSDGLAGIRVAKRWGIIDAAGATVIKPTYAAVGAFQYGVCPVQKGSVWGLIDRSGTVLLRIKYSEISAFDPIYQRAWVRQNKLWGLLSAEGKMVLAPAWGQHGEFGGNTLCPVAYKGKYGFIDAGGKTRIMNLYTAASAFTADYAAVVDEGGQVRYINKTQHGFTIETDVPVECRQGFIEARQVSITETPVTSETGELSTLVTRSYAFALYDAKGNTIPVEAYTAAGV